MTHPRRQPGQSFEDHQRETAAWIGTSVAEMNRSHDRWHVSLAKWLGATSHALRESTGGHLSEREAMLAAMEEDAVLAISRYAVHAGVDAP